MTDLATADPYGNLTDHSTLTIQRVLPGPVDRVWAYLTESDLRRRWFAAGEMQLAVGAPVELVWRNDELTDPSGQRPDGVSGENRMKSRILELDPPRKLSIAWGSGGAVVSFELAAYPDHVLLTIVHRGVPDRASLLNFAPGWHMHLDVLTALLTDRAPEPFWEGVRRLRAEYDRRLPA